MAAKQTVITLTHGNEQYQTIVNKLLHSSSKVREELVSLRNFFHAAAGGDRSVKAVVRVNSGDAVAASGTLTFSSITGANTFVIGSETFTCENSGASGNNQFNKGASDTAAAVNAVAKINAHPNLMQTVVASNVAGVITVTCIVPGLIGNYITLTGGTHVTASASTLASGADAATYSAQNTYHSGV